MQPTTLCALICATVVQNEGPPEQWPLAAAGRQRAAGAATDGVAGVACRNTQAPLPLPDFVPHNQVPPDIHPGEGKSPVQWKRA